MLLQVHEGAILSILAGQLVVRRRGLFRRRDGVFVRLEGFFFRSDGGFSGRVYCRHGSVFWHHRRRGRLGRLDDGQLRDLWFLGGGTLPPCAEGGEGKGGTEDA